MVPGDEGTLVRKPTEEEGDTEVSGEGTMIVMSTLESDKKPLATNVNSNNDVASEITSDLGTMVINEDSEQGDDGTMVTRSKFGCWLNLKYSILLRGIIKI